jgi:hypothetical protein
MSQSDLDSFEMVLCLLAAFTLAGVVSWMVIVACNVIRNHLRCSYRERWGQGGSFMKDFK